jgi:hypothetical protein
MLWMWTWIFTSKGSFVLFILHIYVFNLYKGLTVYARVDGT